MENLFLVDQSSFLLGLHFMRIMFDICELHVSTLARIMYIYEALQGIE